MSAREPAINDRVAAGTAMSRRTDAVRPTKLPLRRPIHLTAGLLCVLAVAAGGTWWYARSSAEVGYATAPATRGPVVRSITATGTVNPVLTIIVGSNVSGVIQEVYCDYNTKVKKGQLCAKIDPRPYQTAADQDRANLTVAKAQLAKDRANLAYTKGSWERNAALVKRGWVSQDTADNAESVYRQAEAQVAVDEATIQQRQATLATAEVNLGYTNIISPVDGTVVSRNITIGQTVAASFQTPTLFLIATDLTEMQVDTNVSESDIGNIKEGSAATFTVDAFPDHPFAGVVTQVRQAPQTIQNVVTFDAVVTVDNPELLLKPGMTATTRIVTARRDDALRVPNRALRYMPGGMETRTATAGPGRSGRGSVWVLRDGRPVEVPVTLGIADETFSEIRSGGIAAGDPIIVSEERSRPSGNTSAALRAPRL